VQVIDLGTIFLDTTPGWTPNETRLEWSAAAKSPTPIVLGHHNKGNIILNIISVCFTHQIILNIEYNHLFIDFLIIS